MANKKRFYDIMSTTVSETIHKESKQQNGPLCRGCMCRMLYSIVLLESWVEGTSMVGKCAPEEIISGTFYLSKGKNGLDCNSVVQTKCPISFEDQSFRHLRKSGIRVWNNLPLCVIQTDSLMVFESRLKIHLYSLAFNYHFQILLLILCLCANLLFLLSLSFKFVFAVQDFGQHGSVF